MAKSSRRVRAHNPFLYPLIAAVALALIASSGYIWYRQQQDIAQASLVATSTAVQATSQSQTTIAQVAQDAVTATAAAALAEIERQYQAALAFQAAGDNEQARAGFQKVITLDPGYKDTAARLKQTSDALAEGYYQQGVAAADQKLWPDAVANFDKVLALAPNYKDAATRRAAAAKALNATSTPKLSPLIPTTPVMPSPSPPLLPIPAVEVRADWSQRMRFNQSHTVRVLLIYKPGQIIIPTIKPINTAVVATIMPVGTPGPIMDAMGSQYELFLVARLDGTAFDIQPAAEQEYRMIGQDSISWTWSVYPKSEGDQSLNVTVFARWKLTGGNGNVIQYPLFDQNLDTLVEVPLFSRRPIDIFSLLTGLLIGLLTWTAPRFYEWLKNSISIKDMKKVSNDKIKDVDKISKERNQSSSTSSSLQESAKRKREK